MRFVIKNDGIEVWRSNGNVRIYPNSRAATSAVLKIVRTYDFSAQHFKDRVIFTQKVGQNV